MINMGMPVHNFTPEQIKQQIKENAEAFKNNAPTTSAEAADVILSAVKKKQWRILVGDDAKAIDEWVRVLQRMHTIFTIMEREGRI